MKSWDHEHLYAFATNRSTAGNEYKASFYALLNDAILTLVRSLPRSTQTNAMIFFIQHSGIEPGYNVDFFRNYYSPIWSVIPHIITRSTGVQVKQDFMYHAAIAHAMVMLLHSLDNHINDSQIAPDHLTLLIRSQAWKLFWDSIAMLCSLVHKGKDIVNSYLDGYYASIIINKRIDNLEEYLHTFKDQMATALIVPLLTVQYVKDMSLEEGVRYSLEHFGLAWRIYDDIQDMKYDLNCGRDTAVTLSLPIDVRHHWNELLKIGTTIIEKENIQEHKNNSLNMLEEMILASGVIPVLTKRIIKELQAAAKHAEDIGLCGLSDEIMKVCIHFVQGMEVDDGECNGSD
ncbi:MAG: hypothetical protein QHH74_02545 [Spirochaetota bacterium]|nr:hypothetical protein [Spirochaetota bacterium]